jgi:hypothetical protein
MHHIVAQSRPLNVSTKVTSIPHISHLRRVSLLARSLCNSKIIMRFSAITVTVFALAAQLTLTSGKELSCENEVEACLQVVLDQCDGATATYCLQSKDGDLPDTCKSSLLNSGKYSHLGVYVNGEGVDLTTTGGDLPEAFCTDGEAAPCAYKTPDKGGKNSCYALGDFPFLETSTNVGLKCKHAKQGPCVTVPIVGGQGGTHETIIFAVKDRNGCEGGTDDWECSSEEDGDGNSCACSGSKSACIFEVPSGNPCPA